MDRPPTHADADLILRLYDMRREPRMRDGSSWFKPAPAEDAAETPRTD